MSTLSAPPCPSQDQKATTTTTTMLTSRRILVQNTPEWMERFLEALTTDSTQLALDLSEYARQDDYYQSSLQAMAFRLLQELSVDNKQTKKTPTAPGTSDFEWDSPYSIDFHAETDERAFGIFQKLIKPEQDGKASAHANALLGDALADSLIQVHEESQTYSSLLHSHPEWKKKAETVPKDLLLLLLPASRLATADVHTLNQIIVEFKIHNLIRVAIDDWGLEDEFSKLLDAPKRFVSKDCQHCLIFVARAYSCMYALKWTNIRDMMSHKVLRCLRLLQDNIIHKEILGAEQNAASRIEVVNKLRRMPVERGSLETGAVLDRFETVEGDNVTPIKVPVLDNNGSSSDDVELCGIKWKPVEKLCLKTGQVLERFETAVAAQESVSYSSSFNHFQSALTGKNHGVAISHSYRGFFWRLEGTNHLPPPEQQKATNTAPQNRAPLCDPSKVSRKSKGKKRKMKEIPIEKRSAEKIDPHADRQDHLISGFPLDDAEMKYKPVEKLCAQSGRVLERFETAKQAQESVTNVATFHSFHRVLEGRYNKSGPSKASPSGNDPRVYKGFFWRLTGTSYLPLCLATYKKVDTSGKRNRAKAMVASKRIPIVDPIVSDLRLAPVEKLCSQTGRVLKRFNTGEAAHQSVTGPNGLFHTFRAVLKGRYRAGKDPRVYKGFFWRLAGTDHLPLCLATATKLDASNKQNRAKATVAPKPIMSDFPVAINKRGHGVSHDASPRKRPKYVYKESDNSPGKSEARRSNFSDQGEVDYSYLI